MKQGEKSQFWSTWERSHRIVGFESVQFSHSVVSDSLWPRGLQHAKLPSKGVQASQRRKWHIQRPGVKKEHCVYTARKGKCVKLQIRCLEALGQIGMVLAWHAKKLFSLKGRAIFAYITVSVFSQKLHLFNGDMCFLFMRRTHSLRMLFLYA